MQKVLPETGEIGSVLKIQGVFLDKTKVDEVYLSDHTFDMKVKVLDQTDDTIEFRVPPFAKPGRLQLVVKTTGKEPEILEQPVYITVEDASAAEEVNPVEKVNPKDQPKQTLEATAANPPPAAGTK